MSSPTRLAKVIYQSQPPIPSLALLHPSDSQTLLGFTKLSIAMPPKRKSTAAADVASKKSKASTDNAADNAPENAPENPQVPRSKRWSKGLSGSANADTEFRTIIARNPDSLWKFACQCRPIVGSDDDDKDEDGEDEGEGEGEPKKADGRPCDGGKTCLCTKPIEEHPDHPYSFSLGGIQKFTTTCILCDLRNPDMFDMYIYNDFYGYGLVEVLGNLLLDFEEAKDDWKQQWYICEAVTLFFFRYDPAALFMYVVLLSLSYSLTVSHLMFY